MRLTPAELAREAAATGFQPESLEKVVLLMELLEAIRSHPFLKSRLALKGGTALNLFVFDVPRLSVDIDLNYIGAADREGMLADRPKIEQAIQAVCGRVGIQPRRVPDEHAGGKWRLSYRGISGASVTLELDVNFMLRAPLWPVRRVDSRPVGSFVATAQIGASHRLFVAADELRDLECGHESIGQSAIRGRSVGRQLRTAHAARCECLLRLLSAATFLIFFQAFMVAPLLPRLAAAMAGGMAFGSTAGAVLEPFVTW